MSEEARTEINEHLRKWEPLRIEILDEKNNHYQLSSYIEQVHSESMIISPPKFADQYYDLPVGSEISIVFYRSDGILYAQCEVQAKQSGDQPRLKMSLPYNIELIDRRRAKRNRMSMKTEIEYYLNKNSINKKVLNVTTSDINHYGISYLDTSPLGKYHNIKCRIYINNDYSDPIQASCKFIYSQKKQINGKIMYKTALEFTKISAEDLERLQQKCFRKSYA